jgi:hypothetical protein
MLFFWLGPGLRMHLGLAWPRLELIAILSMDYMFLAE